MKSNRKEEKEPISDRIEFHRNAVALMPESRDPQPGVAIVVLSEKVDLSFRGCSCSQYKSKTCQHIKDLTRTLSDYRKGKGIVGLYDEFKNSTWYRMAELLSDTDKTPWDAVRIIDAEENNEPYLKIMDHQDRELICYAENGSDKARFIDRLVNTSEKHSPNRADAINRLALLTLSENERKLMDIGMKTRLQTMEETFWFRMAYHAFRELGAGGFSLNHEIDKNAGHFRISVIDGNQHTAFRFNVPPKVVGRLIKDPGIPLSEKKNLVLSSQMVRPSIRIRKDRRGAIRLSPVYVYESDNGDRYQFSHKEAIKFTFGSLFYIPQTDILAPVTPTDALFKTYGNQTHTTIGKGKIPDFLKTYGEVIRNGTTCLIEESAQGLEVFSEPSRIIIDPSILERDWCWLSVTYGFGNASLSMGDILKARNSKQRYVHLESGWLDLQSDALKTMFQLLDQKTSLEEETALLKLKRMHLFRLLAGAKNRVEITGKKPETDLVRQMLSIKPSTELPDITDMTSTLRSYQYRGVEWLWFLYENGFGGLLCDDMGLGKTHQLMAFMLCLKQKTPFPFLVVCPTTVISHWEKKIRQHAPTLKAIIYHGQDRNLISTLKRAQVLITSYGILLRDQDQLANISFSLIVFDEIQHIKNAGTKSYKASMSLTADMKVGLTGTPIENSLLDLKSSMDLILPDYLGTDSTFKREYVEPVEKERNYSRGDRLNHMISPFILRRLKSSVLTELPEKIEDLRFCMLSDDQVKLYRDTLKSRSKAFMKTLQSSQENIPYIHIFALLVLLKQICNHPAQLKDDPTTYHRYQSGKWDLLVELLDEALESGQKVVVYSQFVKMIHIISLYLSEKAIDHVVLTGQSRKRGDLIDRFNDDPACRVFVGSLKAGGSGIDLVAGSVVIHYDRWWNAAREDQATDRVHRIGQRRGVQVFKLVTEGTLEEKIAAIIDKKKNLMERVVKEDDPNLLKTFSRDELIELLTFTDQMDSK